MIDLHIHTDTPDELMQTLRLLSGKADVLRGGQQR